MIKKNLFLKFKVHDNIQLLKLLIPYHYKIIIIIFDTHQNYLYL